MKRRRIQNIISHSTNQPVNRRSTTMSNTKKSGGDPGKYVVIVDSRGRSTSDLEAYKEYKCSTKHFDQLIVNHYNNICVVSEVAELCGLDLKVYFYDPIDCARSSFSSDADYSNGVASLLTFNPHTGHCKNRVHGKAYVVWNNGDLPLSKRQVWGIQELIKEARNLYNSPLDNQTESTLHHKAQHQLLKWCDEYRLGTWGPHSLYETRKHLHHHHAHHGNDESCDIREQAEKDHNDRCLDDVAGSARSHPRPHLYRHSSGYSDVATCHHGKTHVHHVCHHSCCRRDLGDKYDVPEANPYEESPPPSVIIPTTRERLKNALYASH